LWYNTHMPKTKKKIAKLIAPSPPDNKEYSIEQITHPKKRLFLEHFYATDGNVSKTTKAIKIHRRCYYNWLETDPAFNYLIQEQKAQLLDEIDEICRNNAKSGSKESVTERIFWLKTHHPEYKQQDTLAYKDSNGNQFVLSRGR
jgi:hypothetical protein